MFQAAPFFGSISVAFFAEANTSSHFCSLIAEFATSVLRMKTLGARSRALRASVSVFSGFPERFASIPWRTANSISVRPAVWVSASSISFLPSGPAVNIPSSALASVHFGSAARASLKAARASSARELNANPKALK